MKKTILLLAAICVTAISNAQLGILVTFGPTYNGVKSPTFEKFRTNYNDFESAGLKTPLNKLPNATSVDYLLGVNFGGFYISYGKNKYTSTSEATGISGTKRTFDFVSHSSLLEFGFLSSLHKNENGKYSRFGFGGGLCFGFNSLVVASSFTTANGYRDYGSGNRLNGFYSNTSTDYLLMLQAGVNVYRGITITGKFYYNVFNGSLNSASLIDHQQDDQVQTTGPRWVNIPTNYKRAVQEDLDTRLISSDGGNTIQANCNYYRLMLALNVPLSLDLIKTKKEK